MSQATQIPPVAMQRTALKVYNPPRGQFQVARWRINGFPASIIIWTAEEWEKLADRPSDAQYYPCGVWCALRLE